MSQGKGLPIYSDSIERAIAETTSEYIDVSSWHPADVASRHLWRCFETIQDIANLLEEACILNSKEKQRRRAKIIVTPLYSLCISIQDLCNNLTSSPDIRNRLSNKDRVKINTLLRDFLVVVPLEQSSPMRGVRDKLSAHVDKKLYPNVAQDIFSRAQNHEIGHWLHNCIILLMEILSHDIFSWTTDDDPPGYFRIMNVEPWLVTFQMNDGQPVAFAGLHIANSPKNLIAESCDIIVKKSQWMFRDEDSRISSLIHDE
jgi:hypothetical protein